MQAIGSWVWDCDHYQGRGEKTEFHPFRVTWVERHRCPRRPSPTGAAEGDLYMSTDATPAGQEAECAHETKGTGSVQAMRSRRGQLAQHQRVVRVRRLCPAAASERRHLVGASSTAGECGAVRCESRQRGLRDDLPEGRRSPSATASSLRSRCSSAGRTGADGRAPAPALRLAARPARDGPELPAGQAGVPVANESTLLGQIATAPGEWQVEWSVDGIWGRWPGTLAAHDGSVVPRDAERSTSSSLAQSRGRS